MSLETLTDAALTVTFGVLCFCAGMVLRPPPPVTVCPRVDSLVLSSVAPETLRPPMFGDFTDATHYQAAVSKFRDCGTWATD